jgi:hypothetical protein
MWISQILCVSVISVLSAYRKPTPLTRCLLLEIIISITLFLTFLHVATEYITDCAYNTARNQFAAIFRKYKLLNKGRDLRKI